MTPKPRKRKPCKRLKQVVPKKLVGSGGRDVFLAVCPRKWLK